MNNSICTDKELLVAYLYDECDDDERVRMEAHLAACTTCARELDELRGVRMDLAGWSPPEQALGFKVVRDNVPRAPRWRYASVQAWALVAAAVLVFAAGAAVANIEVRYGSDGLVVRTGWTSRSQDSIAPTAAADAPWRSDLASLERQFRDRLETLQAEAGGQNARSVNASSVPSPNAVVGSNDAELIRRVRMLIDESEKRQQRELALRVTQLVRDVDTQRRADLVRIQQGFGRIEGLTNTEVARQREMLNYLVRVSQRPQQ